MQLFLHRMQSVLVSTQSVLHQTCCYQELYHFYIKHFQSYTDRNISCTPVTISLALNAVSLTPTTINLPLNAVTALLHWSLSVWHRMQYQSYTDHNQSSIECCNSLITLITISLTPNAMSYTDHYQSFIEYSISLTPNAVSVFLHWALSAYTECSISLTLITESVLHWIQSVLHQPQSVFHWMQYQPSYTDHSQPDTKCSQSYTDHYQSFIEYTISLTPITVSLALNAVSVMHHSQSVSHWTQSVIHQTLLWYLDADPLVKWNELCMAWG